MIIKLIKLLIITFYPVTLFCQTAHGYKITGSIENLDDSVVVFLNNDNYNKVIDSTKAFHSQFTFIGRLEEPTHLSIIINNRTLPLMVGEKDSGILIESDSLLLNVKVTGSLLNEERKRFDSKIQKKYKDAINNLFFKLSSDSAILNKEKKKDSILNEIQLLRNNFYSEVKNYIMFNSNSELSLYLLYTFKNEIGINYTTVLYKALQDRLKNFPISEFILQYININNAGSIAPDFKLYSSNGNLFQLYNHDSKGFILLDFWASWCEPCLKDLSKINSLKNRYNKGLDIISISIDTDSSKWLNILEKYECNWIELIDPKKEIADKYFIKAIPRYFLLDRNYKVLESIEDINDLAQKLENIYFINDGIDK